MPEGTQSAMHPGRLRAATSAVLALSVVACSPVDQPEPTASGAATQPPEAEGTMVVGVHIPAERALGQSAGSIPSDLPLYSLHPNGSLWDTAVGRFVYSGVYRLDETQSPVPDLAEAPCDESDDLLVITCRLREAEFHDGSPVTAGDVAFTYQMFLSDYCRFPACVDSPDFDRFAAATAVDDRTVEFRLAEPDPAFITAILPDVLIEPRARLEAAFAQFVEASDGADAASLESVAARLAEALRPEDPVHPGEVLDCESAEPQGSVLAEAETVIAGIDRELRSRDAYALGAEGTFDICAYGDYLVRILTDASDALRLTGIDAIAAAYRILEHTSPPIGSGPWRVESIDPGASMKLVAFDDFHRGIPATERLEVRLIRSTAEAVEAVRSGAVHWLLQPFPAAGNLVAEGVADAPGVIWVEYARFGFYALHYNLRDGRLFEDRNLREAMELCIDKAETVAAATRGQGVPIYSPISPSMWAFDPDLPQPTRDTAIAQELIEASGWALGDDGIYRKGEQRLATTVPVRDDRPDHLRFMQLLAFQVEECGIEIVPRLMSFGDMIVAVTWPLVPPGADEPWDAILAGWTLTPDPDPSYLFHTSALATEDFPDGFNYMGYSSEEADALLDQQRETYDAEARAHLLREFQQLLAEDRPMLFGWSDRRLEPRSDRLESAAGPLATDTSTWWWQLETLSIPSPDP